jgi:hypothetical protein
MSEKILFPNQEDIKKFFDLITQQWRSQEAENCFLEVRCLGENKKPLSQKFSYKKIPDAVEFAKAKNDQKYNVYTTINPISPNVDKNARDENVSLAFFNFADADDLTGVDALKKFCDIQKPEFTVITGRIPHLRFHGYWRLLEPCSDMALWRETQEQIALNFQTDTVVKNPSRIMRVPGTISYPNGKKRAQAYIDELVVLRTNPNPIPFADISSWSNFLQKPARSETFDIDLGKNSLDLNALKEAILSGQNWHDNILRLAGRLVADGSSKEEILGLAAEFTLAGYTEQQTRNELVPMIEGALAKGFDQKTNRNVDCHLRAYPPKQVTFSIITADELLCKELPPPEWVLQDMLPIGLTLLAGAPKVGKSWFALDLARQIVNAGHECLYLSLEDNERRLKARLECLSISPNKRLKMLAGLSNETPFPKGDEAISELRKIHNATPELKAIIVDTVQGIRRSSKRGEKGYEESVEEWSKLRSLAHELQICLLAVHHTGKKNSDADRTPIERIMGSQGIAGTAETIMVLEQKTGSQNVILHMTGKEVEQREISYNWLNPGFSEDGDARYAELGSFQKSIFNYIKHHPRCTQTSIVNEFHKHKSQVSEAVSRLLEKRFIEKNDNKLRVVVDI